MNIEKINSIVNSVIGNKYEISTKLSKTTNSYYITVYKGNCKVLLRFSDHLKGKNFLGKHKCKTFIIKDKKFNEQCLARYVKNRIKVLNNASLYAAFDMIAHEKTQRLAMI